MSRRRLFSDRHVLSRRVREMVSSLFHRRRVAPVARNVVAARQPAVSARRAKRKSVADRVRGWMGHAAQSATATAGSGTLTLRSQVPSLAAPETLETRMLLAVTANLGSTTDTLAVWMTEDNDHTFVRQVGDGTTARLQISSKSDFSVIDVYNGAVPANLYVYDGANIAVTLDNPGSGYTTAPTVTISNTTFSTPLSITTSLIPTAPFTFAGTGFAPTATITLQGSQTGITNPVSVTFTTDAAGKFSGGAVAGGANFSSLTAGTITWSVTGSSTGNFTLGTLTGSLSGKVGSLHGTTTGLGYYRSPNITLSGPTSGATFATVAITLNGKAPAAATWTDTGFTSSGATALSSSLRIGEYYRPSGLQFTGSGNTTTSNFPGTAIGDYNAAIVRFSPVENVSLKAGSLAEVRVVGADNITALGNIASGDNAVFLSLFDEIGGAPARAAGNINIGAPISASSLTIRTGGPIQPALNNRNVLITGAVTTTGAASIEFAKTITIGSPLTAGTTFYGLADQDFTVSAPISTGTTVNSWAVLQATTGTLKLDAAVTSQQGTITLQADTLAGAALVTGRSLTLEEGGGAGNYTLNANVTNLAGNTASNLTLKNAGSLTVGQGALSLTGSANTLSLESTGGSINVVANIVMSGSAAGIVSLKAKTNIAVTGTILPESKPLDLTLAAGTGSIAATSALQLGTGNLIASAGTGIAIPNLSAAKINVTTASGNLNVAATNTVIVENATVTGVGNLTLITLDGDIDVAQGATVGIQGAGGTATLQANDGDIEVKGALQTQSSGTFVLNAANGTISNGTGGSLATGTLNWIATSGVQNLLNTAAISNFSGLAANITGTGALQVKTDRDLTLTNVVTKSGDITVTVANTASPANLSITGSVTAGNTLADTNRQNITLSAENGAITSTGVVTGNVLDLKALKSSSLSNQNILQLNATISGAGENLAVTATSGLKTGDIDVNDGSLDITVTGGNLTRGGTISAGPTAGIVNLSVASGKILGVDPIVTETLRFKATAMPDLAAAAFTTLNAVLAAPGDIVVDRPGPLAIENATTTFGDIKINLSAGDLTIAGPLSASGPGNVTLSVPAGGVLSTGSPAPLVANVLSVTSQNDIDLATDVNKIAAKVTHTSGNITIVETNGLIIGGDNVTAANDISITVLAGDLERTGQINSTTPGDVTLNVPGGAITGSGQVTAGNLAWTSKASADINGTSGLSFTNLAATVTGPGNGLTITGTGSIDVKVTKATTVGGALTITAGGSANISLDGPVSAGSGNVTLTAAGGKVTSTTPDRVTGNHLTVTAGNDTTLNTDITSLAADIAGTGKALAVNEASGLSIRTGEMVTATGDVTLHVGTTAAGGLSGAGSITGDNVTILANALGFGGAAVLGGTVKAVNLVLDANGTSSLNTDVANLTANVTSGGLTIVEEDDLDVPTEVVAAGLISITSTAGNITGDGVVNAGAGDVVLSAATGGVTLDTVANQVVGNTLTIAALNDVSVATNVKTLVAAVASGSLTVTEADDLVIGAANADASGIVLNLVDGSLTGLGQLNAGVADVSINAAFGGVTFKATGARIVGGTLTIDQAKSAVNITTAVASLTANVTGSGNAITVVQTGDLDVHADNIATNDGPISIQATGNVTGDGSILAGDGNVALTSTAGNITLSSTAGQVAGNVLTLSVAKTSVLNTAVTTLFSTVTGDLQDLTINEVDDLEIGAGAVGSSSTSLGSGGLQGGSHGILGALAAELSPPVGGASGAIATIQWNGAAADVLAGGWIVRMAPGTSATAAVAPGWQAAPLGGGLFRVTAPGASVAQVQTWAAGTPGVLYAEPDFAVASHAIPNDPQFGQLWGLHNTGQSGGTPGADIGAVNAWDVTTGSSSVVIAVIDSGIDYTHPDLAGNMWVNPNEIAGDGIDNDGNGFVDDIYGWDFHSGDSNPMDTDGHGTHVAGTIGAIGNNSVGVVGVNWNVRMMALRGLDATGSTSNLIAAVNYATMMKLSGVNIVATNNSWGGGGFSQGLFDAIEAGGQAGIVFVAAAGNGGSDLIGDNNDSIPFYPASYNSDSIISVAATDRNNQRASFSNYGATSVDVGAPGVGIVSTVPGGGYASYNGTSMAAPHVAGLVGLMAAANPSATAAQLRSAVLSTTTPIAALNGKVATGGLVNAPAAIANITSGGATINGGTLEINLAAGSLSGPGTIDVGSGSVVLKAATGGITLSTIANQVVAGSLSVLAQNAVELNTRVNSLSVEITNDGDGLTVVEADGLLIAPASVVTANGDIAITAGSIGGAGFIKSGSGAIDLTASGAIALDSVAGQVEGGDLTLVASAASSLKTEVANLAATITGKLTIVETDDLGIDIGEVTVAGNVAITAGGGISGADAINATGNTVTLSAGGQIVLDASPDRIVAGVLDVSTTAAGDVSVTTNIATLVANVTAGDLTVSEANGLAIGTGVLSVVEADGDISITLADDGSLSGPGKINATGDVTLMLTGTGDLSLASAVNQVASGGTLTIDVTDGKVAVNTAADTLSVAASGAVTVVEADDLTVDAIVAVDATVKLTLTTGSLTIDAGGIQAGQVGNVTLAATLGGITSVNDGTVFANVLSLTAGTESTINTAITTLNATVTGAGESLTITETDDAADPTPDGLTIGTVVTNAGDITLDVTTGDLRGTGSLNTLNTTTNESGNVTLLVPTGAATLASVPGQIVANELAVAVLRSSNLATNVASLNQVGGTSAIEGIASLSGITGNATTDVITATGHALLNGDVVHFRNLAGGTGLTNNTPYFVVNATGSGLQVSTKLGGTPVNFTSKITDGSIHATQRLTIVDVDDLSIAGDIVAENDADIAITVGGNLTHTAGAINSISGNVTLTAATGAIGADTDRLEVVAATGLLTLTARDDSYLETEVASLTANVTAGLLDVVQTGDLQIAAGDVRATDGVTIQASGDIAGGGRINAVANDVTLTSTGGGVVLNAVAGQVVGGVLNLSAATESFVNTSVNSLTAGISGNGENLTVVETNGLALDVTGGVTTNDGTILLKLTQGSLTGSETIDAGTGDVALDVLVGGITLTGEVVADSLDVRSVQSAVLGKTNVATLSAAIAAGSLTVAEFDDLDIDSTNGVRAFAGVAITVGNATQAGNLGGGGAINGGASNVTLTAPSGNVTLDAVEGQVVGNLLNLTARETSVVNTAITTLVANITQAGASLAVNERDSLAIAAASVKTDGGDVAITTGGNLSIIGQINATSSIDPADLSLAGDVTLVINGAVTGVGSIVANSVDLEAVNASSLNVNVAKVSALVTRDGQSLTISSAGPLTIDGSDVSTSNGSITISTAAGDLTITGGALDAGAANVTLNAAGGITATASAGQIVGNVLTVTAVNSTSLKTSVTSLSANISGSGKTLTVVEEDSLAIGSAGLRTADGKIDLRVAAGSLTLANPVNAGSGNVVLNVADGISGTAAGLVTGQCLTVNVAGTSSLVTNVTEITGETTGGILGIRGAAGLKIAAGGLAATGAGGLNLVAENGPINVAGPVNTAGGPIALTTIRGDVTGTQAVNATSSGNVSLTVAGDVNLTTSTGQLTANVLGVVASGNVAVNTDIDGLTASLNGTGRTLTIVDKAAFSVRGTGVSTNNANVALTAAGAISLPAGISAGNRTISLLATGGGISGLGVLGATNLLLSAVGDVAVATKVANLTAAVVGTNSLVVNQSGSLAVSQASTGGGPLTLNVAGGSLTGTGLISASPVGNVVLNAASGAVTLNVPQQVVANVVSLLAQNASVVSLAATTFGGTITGAGQALTVFDTNALALANVTTAGGALAVHLAAGDLTGAGFVNVGSANVTLNVGGGVGLSAKVGQITANDLSVRAASDVAVNTSVNTLSANVTGVGKTLTVNEFNGLALTTGDVRATDDISINVAAGNLNGTRTVTSTAGDVTLAAPGGTVTLTARTGQVSAAGLLTVTALGNASLNTNVADLAATLSKGSLSVSQASSLRIAGSGVNTASGGGNVSLTILNGGLSHDTGSINAGAGTVTLNVARGNVALDTAVNLVSGNVLNVVSRGDATINTAVGTIGNAAVTSTGSLTIVEADGLTVTRATAARNDVSIEFGDSSTLTVANITASRGTVTLEGGNVVVGSPGIRANVLDIADVDSMAVAPGGSLSARTVTQPLGTAVNWQITTVATGPGSLGSVLNEVNKFNGDSRINVTVPTSLTLQAALPQIRAPLTLEGNGLLTLVRGSMSSTAAGLTIATSGGRMAAINGVELRNFGVGIDLRSGSTSTITNVTVSNAATGLRASGVLTGSLVTRSVFDGQNRANSNGAVLSSAQGLQLGENTSSFNTFRNVRDGVSISGVSTGTTVRGNRFEAFARYGLSLVGARGVEIGAASGDLSLRNTVANALASAFGVFASGTSTGSSVNNMLFESSFQGTQYRVSQSRDLTIRPPLS